MRWTVTVFVVKLLARNASASTQKTPVFAAAPSVSPGTAASGPDALSRAEARGGRRRTSACRGIVGTARIETAAEASRGERGVQEPDPEREGELAGRVAEIGLHRPEHDREAVVEDAPRHRFGDREAGHDDPAVVDAWDGSGQRDRTLWGSTAQRPSDGAAGRVMQVLTAWATSLSPPSSTSHSMSPSVRPAFFTRARAEMRPVRTARKKFTFISTVV